MVLVFLVVVVVVVIVVLVLVVVVQGVPLKSTLPIFSKCRT